MAFLFEDCYESTVHLNQSLSDIQKLGYLKAKLERIAAQAIQRFPLTNANYATALN